MPLHHAQSNRGQHPTPESVGEVDRHDQRQQKLRFVETSQYIGRRLVAPLIEDRRSALIELASTFDVDLALQTGQLALHYTTPVERGTAKSLLADVRGNPKYNDKFSDSPVTVSGTVTSRLKSGIVKVSLYPADNERDFAQERSLVNEVMLGASNIRAVRLDLMQIRGPQVDEFYAEANEIRAGEFSELAFTRLDTFTHDQPPVPGIT